MKHFTANTYTKKELTDKHRELAKQLHPDKNNGNDVAFKEMQAEYEKIQSEIWDDIWIKREPIKNKVSIKQNKKPKNVTPEDIKEFAEALHKLFKLFSKL